MVSDAVLYLLPSALPLLTALNIVDRTLLHNNEKVRQISKELELIPLAESVAIVIATYLSPILYWACLIPEIGIVAIAAATVANIA